MPNNKAHRATTGMLFLLDVGENSPHQLTLVRLVMKSARINREDLWEKVSTLPEQKRMDRKTFDESLDILVKEEWLWETEVDDERIYSPRLKTNEGKPR
jgi:hypothetical protein